MKFRFSIIFLAVILLTLLLINGFDLTHHVHNSWMYYQMFSTFHFTGIDPYLSQITYAYGVPAYALAGLLWFFFSIHSISIIMGLTIIINYIILVKWFKKKDSWVSGLILLNIFFTIWDAYVAAFSNCLFWLASYAYFNKKPWWPIPLIIAAFNHPYTLVSSLIFVVQAPILLVPLSITTTYFIIASKLFTTGIFLPIYTVFMLLGRFLVNMMPIFAMSSRGLIKIKDLNIIEWFSNIKMKMPALLITGIVLVSVALTLSFYTLTYQPRNNIDFTMFEGIPLVNGTVRVVDYMYLPSVYILPTYNFTLESGSFRENNPQHLVKTTWSNVSEYSLSLESRNISYVLFCKMCNPQSNEKDMLNLGFDLIWENDYYYLFNTSLSRS